MGSGNEKIVIDAARRVEIVSDVRCWNMRIGSGSRAAGGRVRVTMAEQEWHLGRQTDPLASRRRYPRRLNPVKGDALLDTT